MKCVIWFILLAASAIGLALFMGDNHASVMLFWPPYRISLSVNLLLILLLGFFALLYFALRGLQALLAMPSKAQHWRTLYHERSMYQHLLQAHLQLWTGRYSRAAKSAAQALDFAQKHAEHAPHAADLEIAAAHLLAAESAHQLRDADARQKHFARALKASQSVPEASEALALRAARWAAQEGDTEAAWQQLQSLPQGAQRRVHALRIKLKTAQLAGEHEQALETARLLIKHNAFSPFVAQTLQTRLIRDFLTRCQDMAQLQKAWSKLTRAEQALPEVTFYAAERMLQLAEDETEQAQVRSRLAPLLKRYAELPEGLQLNTVLCYERCLAGLHTPDLQELEQIQQAHRSALPLQYLLGAAYLQLQLWGKAQHSLQALVAQKNLAQEQPELARRAWLHLARLAEAQERSPDAQHAWKQAALLANP